MIRKITLLFLACIGLCLGSNAQGIKTCGFDDAHQQMMAQDPKYAQLVNQFKGKWANWMAQQQNLQSLIVTLPSGDSVYEIPVVVHILDTTNNHGISRYNHTDVQIQAVIDYVNKTFDATWPAYPNTTYVPVRFTLAKRDPSCNATTGINRINAVTALGGATGALYNTSGVGRAPANIGITDAQAKSITGANWPNLQYYNIWVINRINGINGIDPVPGSFVAGYAYFPTFSNLDGTIMLSSQFKTNNTVLPHELGHAFSLYHTFQGSTAPSGPPPSGTCALGPCAVSGDEICDTEPHNDNDPGSCPTVIGCSNNPYVLNTQKNIMAYSSCPDRLTPQQSARIMQTINDVDGPRSCLISSLGATPPGLSPVAVAASCAPVSPVNPNNTPSGVYRVNISTATNSVVYMNVISGGYSDDGTAYVDNTCKHMAQLRAGATYRVTIETAPNFVPTMNENVLVYIDYNNNGLFSATEQILSSSNNNLHTTTFTVPATTATYCVPLRMRVVSERSSSTPPSPCGNRVYGQVEDYSVVIKGSGTTPSTPGLATIIQPPLGGNPSCLGSGVTVAATYLNTIGPVWYKWYRKLGVAPYTVTEIMSSADSFVNRNDWTDLDTVWAKVAYPGLCGIDTTLTDSITLYRPLTVAPTVTISVTKGTNPGCPDDTVRFTVTGNVNPGGAPTYEWFVNGISQGPATSTPYWEAFNIPSGTTFRVRMNSSASSPCSDPGFALSNTITYTHTTKAPTLSIALISGTNPGCPNQALTFLATGTTTGPTPSYEWKVNSITVQTGASNTYTAVLNDNDVVSCIMTSSTSCAVPNTATSTNTITITHTPLIADVTILQIKGNSPACTGHEMVFVATPTNSGANPQFQWMVNNAPVAGANSPVFSTYSLLNGDFVSCILISTDPCVSNTFDTSAILPMVITTSKTPSVTVAITKGNNPGCLDSLVEFTATDKDLGTSPNFDWLVNGFQTFNGQVFSTNNLLNGDVVTCRANQTDGGCYLPDTVTSAPITMVRSTTPEPPIISLVYNNLVTNKTGSFVWFGPAGQLTGGENGSFHPVELGQYYCVTNNNGCWSKPSNKLTITLLDINTYNISEVSIYPNPTTGRVELDWGGRRVNMLVSVYSTVGQKLMDSDVKNQSHATLDLSKLANGIYFIVVTDEQGKSGTARITVTK